MSENPFTLATRKGGEFSDQPLELSVIPPSSLETMQRAEIDVQIATAHRFPRSMERFKRDAISMATLDEETAESCIYRRPVGKEKGEVIFAEGLSVRMAEIVGACYGNLRVYAMIIEQTDRQVVARGMAIDLEKNFASSSEIIESTVTKEGRPFSERMRILIAKAAIAKARRDATFQVVPKALARPIEAEVRKVLVGDATTIERRRQKVVGWINKLGIEAGRVYAALGVEGPSDLGADQLEKLTGLRTAIKDGDVSIDEAFPEIVGKPEFKEQKAEPKPRAKKAEDTPAKATPTEAARNLIKASGITEEDAIRFINAELEAGYKTLDEADEGAVETLVSQWHNVLPKIKALAAVQEGGAE